MDYLSRTRLALSLREAERWDSYGRRARGQPAPGAASGLRLRVFTHPLGAGPWGRRKAVSLPCQPPAPRPGRRGGHGAQGAWVGPLRRAPVGEGGPDDSRAQAGAGRRDCGVRVGTWGPEFYNVPRSAARALCTQHGTPWQSEAR